MRSICVSLGGSLIAGEDGFDIAYVKELARLVGGMRDAAFVIVCGAGSYCRSLMELAREAGVRNNIELDRIGIQVTRLNAYMVKGIFKANGVDVAPLVPTDVDELRGLVGRYKAVICGGFAEGVTTDTDAALAAEATQSKLLINASRISYVYDKDPKRHKDARRLERLTFDRLIKISNENDRRNPGSNVIFDSFAAKLVARSGITVKFVGGEIGSLKDAVSGRPHKGTTVD